MTMITVKTSELTGKALRYAVAVAEGMSVYLRKHVEYDDDKDWVLFPDGTIRHAVEIPSNSMSRHFDYTHWEPDQDWSQGGPLVDLHVGNVWEWNRVDLTKPKVCGAAIYVKSAEGTTAFSADGPTKLIAAMRTLVLSKLGEVVSVPEACLK